MLPTLIVITDWSLGEQVLLERLAAVLSLSPRIAVQHRDPEAPIRRFVELGRKVAELCARGGNPLFVNARVDVALLFGAHLHLPASGVRVGDARAVLPRGKLISAAVHDEREAAESDGADLVLVSPVFQAGSKPDDTREPLGVEGFERVALRCKAPAYALGGMTPETVAKVPTARGFAVISGVLRAKDPKLAATRMLARGGVVIA